MMFWPFDNTVVLDEWSLCSKKAIQLSFDHFPCDEKEKRKWLQLIKQVIFLTQMKKTTFGENLNVSAHILLIQSS